MIGVDAGGEYEYVDIKDYDECCTCRYFSDNWHEERFECLNIDRDDDCYKG